MGNGGSDLSYSRIRQQFGRALPSSKHSIQVTEMAVELEASRLLVHQAAAAHDRNDADSGLKSSMVKLRDTSGPAHRRLSVPDPRWNWSCRRTNHGAALSRRAALRIHEGTSEIQKLLIARELLK